MARLTDRTRVAAAAVALAWAVLPAGCRLPDGASGWELNRDERGFYSLEPVRVADKLRQAVSSDSPDERREGVVWLSDPARCSLDNVVELLGLVARQDPDPTVRSAAVEALGRSSHPAAIAPLVAALEDSSAFVRLDATLALGGKEHDTVKRALLIRLGRDSDPQVRAAAARGLGRYRERRVLEALVAALRDADFAVAYHAEKSLIGLTGHTFRHDAEAWTRWLSGLGPEDDPFALAGQMPVSLQPSRQLWIQRISQSLRDAWFWWQADERPGR